MSKRKQRAKQFAKETLDAGYQYRNLGDNTFELADSTGRKYDVKDAGLEANRSNVANMFATNRRQRILNARALAREAALRGATPSSSFMPVRTPGTNKQTNTTTTDTTNKSTKTSGDGENKDVKLRRRDIDKDTAKIELKKGTIGTPYENPTLNLTAGPEGKAQKFEDISTIKLGKHNDRQVLVPTVDMATPENQYMYVDADADESIYEPVKTGTPGLTGADGWYKMMHHKGIDKMSDMDVTKAYLEYKTGKSYTDDQFKAWLQTPQRDGRIGSDAIQDKTVMAKMRQGLVDAKKEYDTPRPYLSWEHGNFDRVANTGWTFNFLTDLDKGVEIPSVPGTKTPEGLKIVRNRNFSPLYIANTGDRDADWAKAQELQKKYNMQGKWYMSKDKKGMMFDPEGAYAGARFVTSAATWFPELYDLGSAVGVGGAAKGARAAAEGAKVAGTSVGKAAVKGFGKGLAEGSVGQGVKQFARRTGTSAVRQAGYNPSWMGAFFKGAYGGAKGATSSIARGVGGGVWNAGKGLLSETGGTIGNLYRGKFAKNVATNAGVKRMPFVNTFNSHPPRYGTPGTGFYTDVPALGNNAVNIKNVNWSKVSPIPKGPTYEYMGYNPVPTPNGGSAVNLYPNVMEGSRIDRLRRMRANRSHPINDFTKGWGGILESANEANAASRLALPAPRPQVDPYFVPNKLSPNDIIYRNADGTVGYYVAGYKNGGQLSYGK